MKRNRPWSAPWAKANVAAGRHAGLPPPVIAPQHPKNRRASLSHRPAGAVHQQPGGTGRADDEIAPEDLRRLPLHGRSNGFRRDPGAAFNSQEAGLGYPANPERQPGQPDRKSPGRVIRLATWAVTFLLTRMGRRTGIYYIDSTPLPVCHPRRINRHRVFAGLAGRGKTSIGWF